jgi:hypothetical protein
MDAAPGLSLLVHTVFNLNGQMPLSAEPAPLWRQAPPSGNQTHGN